MNKTLTSRDQDVLAIGRSASHFRRERRSQASGAVARATRAVRRSMKNFFGGIAEGLRMSRLYDELSGMSDRELAEIGITRGEIPAVVAGTHRISGTARSRGSRAGS